MGIHFGKANALAEKRRESPRVSAEKVAIEALAYLAGEPEALGRFLVLTGIGPAGLRSAARDHGFLAGVLDYFASDERLLLAYADHAGMPPSTVVQACRALNGG